jgi:hypothetical protein
MKLPDGGGLKDPPRFPLVFLFFSSGMPFVSEWACGLWNRQGIAGMEADKYRCAGEN